MEGERKGVKLQGARVLSHQLIAHTSLSECAVRILVHARAWHLRSHCRVHDELRFEFQGLEFGIRPSTSGSIASSMIDCGKHGGYFVCFPAARTVIRARRRWVSASR